MKQRYLPRIFGAFVVSALLVAPTLHAEEEATLYERLGGYDAVSAVVDDFAATSGIGFFNGDMQGFEMQVHSNSIGVI